MYIETTAQTWADLKENFSRLNALKMHQLKQSISSLKQEENYVSLYFMQLKSLWDKLGSIVCITPCTYRNTRILLTNKTKIAPWNSSKDFITIDSSSNFIDGTIPIDSAHP